MIRVRIRPATKLVLVAIAASWAALGQGQTRRDQAAPFPVLETSIEEIHAAFKSGKLTAHQLVQQYLDRIHAYDQQGPRINSIHTLNPKALEEADTLDSQYKKSGLVGPLHGIPAVSISSLTNTGMPCKGPTKPDFLYCVSSWSASSKAFGFTVMMLLILGPC